MRRAQTYRITARQVRMLWLVKHNLALLDGDSGAVPDRLARWRTLVNVSATKLQEILYEVPGSDAENPYSRARVAIASNTDLEALK